jgi:hypothetical protein
VKVRVLSIGVSDYPLSDLGHLISASRDARVFYDTIGEICGHFFVERGSFCLANITQMQFRSVVELFLRDIDQGELGIIFFSGHGTLDQDELVLHLTDSNPSKAGQLSATELAALLKRSGPSEKLLILDCCHAGAAASLAMSNSAFFGTKVSVFASNGILDRAQETEQNGTFTAALVEALLRLSVIGDPLELTAVAAQVRAQTTEFSPILAIHRDIDNLVLPNKHKLQKDAEQFAESFARAIATSNSAERAVMWYALCSEPERTRLRVLANNRVVNVREVTWLGRRAIGSCLDSIVGLTSHKEKLVEQLLSSRNWVENCIGAIGGRKNVSSSDLLPLYKKALKSSGYMDVSWLALLYLGDAKALGYDELAALSHGQFGKTNWGRGELLKQCSNLFPERVGDLLRLLRSSISDDTQALSFDMISISTSESSAARSETLSVTNAADSQIRSFSGRARSRTGRNGIDKWFFSKLHGNWRDHLQEDIAVLIDSMNEGELCAFLRDLCISPNVAAKLGVFDALQRRTLRAGNCRDSWAWALGEEHPWVAREAWRLLIIISDVTNDLSLVINNLDRIRQYDRGMVPGVVEAFAPIVGWLLRTQSDRSHLQEILVLADFSQLELEMLSSHFSRELSMPEAAINITDYS